MALVYIWQSQFMLQERRIAARQMIDGKLDAYIDKYRLRHTFLRIVKTSRKNINLHEIVNRNAARRIRMCSTITVQIKYS